MTLSSAFTKLLRLLSPRMRWVCLSWAERSLIVGVGLYAGLGVLYFAAWSAPIIRYPLTFLSLGLATLVPEFANRKRFGLMILLIGLIAGVTSAIQLSDDSAAKTESSDLRSRLVSLQLTEHRRSQLKDDERKLRDEVRINALDTAKGLVDSGRGFLRKADWLSLRVATAESKLMRAFPATTERLLAYPHAPEQALAAYLHDSPPLGSKSLWEDVITHLKAEVAYRSLALYFQLDIQPRYAALIARADTGKLRVDEVRQSLGEIGELLASKMSTYPIAGLFNHLGNIAMGCQDHERALGLFHLGIAHDSDHIPLYESAGYAEWGLNHNAPTALHYATQGLALCNGIMKTAETNRQVTLDNLERIAELVPDLRSQVDSHKALRALRFKSVIRELVPFVQMLQERFELLYAYCSALELRNEAVARRYAKHLLDSSKGDANYQDSLGVVLMQFGRSQSELEEAERLFIAAEENTDADEITKRLAVMHRARLRTIRRELAIPDRR